MRHCGKRLIALVLALGLGCAAPAWAGNSTLKTIPSFNQIDLNHDGYITQTEAMKAGIRMKEFHLADTDHDNRLNRDEFNNLLRILKGIRF